MFKATPGRTHFEVDVEDVGLVIACGWHESLCCFHVLMAVAWSSVRIGIHFSQVRHCTRELSNRLTFGSAANAALRSSTGWAFFALWRIVRSARSPKASMIGAGTATTHTRLARQLFRWASQGMEQYVEFGRRRIHLSHEAQRTR